ncbi:MAG: hypothetical protein M1814_004887 [Vezdaea aestivalis]|nr:MAG: hypothetical protein M1814_004887 [Vezdaea aestivalis]
MRLFLLPISTRRIFLYGKRADPSNAQSGPPTKASIVDRLTTRAARTWVNWEKRESGWQKTITVYGNKALQRIAYEEWGLKSIPPLSRAAREKGGDVVSVVFPASMVRGDKVPKILRRLATERLELHRKKMWWSVVLMPFTAPFMVVPIVPNLPFFYVAFRAWSHWRAYSGSKHLAFLLDNNLIKNAPTSQLDKIYPVDSLNPGFDNDNPASESVVLEYEEAKEVAEILEVPELAPELERAINQVTEALEKQEAESLSASTPPTSEKDDPKA